MRGANDLRHFIHCAKLSEAAKLDFMFFADSPASAIGDADALARNPTKMNRFEPITAITALSQHTERLGFVATASTSYYEPYNIARLFASADHIARGRIAWNLVTSDHDETGYNYNREGLPPHAERYERGEEFIDTVFGLWDSSRTTHCCWTAIAASITTRPSSTPSITRASTSRCAVR